MAIQNEISFQQPTILLMYSERMELIIKYLILFQMYSSVAQWLARGAHNPEAGGSRPLAAIFDFF